jgi:diguanylate cyclase (GGDEF)-like protein
VAVGRGRTGRQRRSLLVSGGLVLVMGAISLVAGLHATAQARDVHRRDRLELQLLLAWLTDGAQQVLAAELQAELARVGPWSPVPGDAATAGRLSTVLALASSFDVGAVLVDAAGKPLGVAQAPGAGALPDAADPGWSALRSAVERRSSLPLSDLLLSGTVPSLAVGLPVALRDGTTGLVMGLWSVRDSRLQQATSGLTRKESSFGVVVDGRGLVLSSTDPGRLGQDLPYASVRRALESRGAGILEVPEGDADLVGIYAPVGATGWSGVSLQSQSAFEGDIVRSGRIRQGAAVALLLIAGGTLVAMHRRREAVLRHHAMHDELTGLCNRRGWLALAERELELARRQGTTRVVVFVDLDGLKQVNDALGHRQGDRALTALAAVLRAASRRSDLLGRIGGDEFVLMLRDGDTVDTARRRLEEALAEHNAASAEGFELRISIGAALWTPDDDGGDLDDLVRRADVQMYEEKARRPERSEGVVRSRSG